MLKLTIATIFVVGVIGAWAFEPWRLWTHSTIDEPLPTVSGAPAVVAEKEAPFDPAPTPAPVPDQPTTGGTLPRPTEPKTTVPPAPEPAPEPVPALVVLASGGFIDAEHGTSGEAKIIQLADGSRFVRLENLASSDGPDLDVILSDAPSGGDWGTYDDGRYVTLGELKATNGNQNYAIPADVDLDGLQSVVIWCARFNVAFGTAAVA